MYSSLKTISGFIIVLAVINAISAVIVGMIIGPLPNMEVAMFTAIVALMASSALALIVIGVALWNLHGDIDANIASTSDSISSMKKRIEALEKK